MEKQPLDKRIDLVLDKHKNDPDLREKELKLLLKEAEKCADLHAMKFSPTFRCLVLSMNINESARMHIWYRNSELFLNE